MHNPSVVIDSLPESVERYRSGYAVVAVDVIRATTTLATGVALGRRCYVACSVADALARSAELARERPLLVGEVGGDMPEGFDMNNSPAALALRWDIERPMILLSSSGTRLISNARMCETGYIACFRNYAALAAHLVGRHSRVALIGAGTRNQFREEDQMCCAWIAESLVQAGYVVQDAATQEMVARWSGARPEDCRVSKSVAYLTKSNQLQDLEFILSHVNDLDATFTIEGNEIVQAQACEASQAVPSDTGRLIGFASAQH